jgi:hypothetical protein
LKGRPLRPGPFGMEEIVMSLDHAHTDVHVESMDETHSQPQFVGRLAMTLLVLAVLAALFVIIAAVTHGG